MRGGGLLSEAVFQSRCRPRHPLVGSIYFNSQFPKLDVMHVVDHRGLAGCIAGSVLVDLIKRERRLGASQEVRLRTINERLDEWNSNHILSSCLSNIELQNLTREDGWSMLKGPLVKAANTRNLIPYVESLCVEFYSEHDDFGNSVLHVVKSLNRVYHVLYSAGMFLSTEELSFLTEAVDSVGWHLQNLRFLCQQSGDLHFCLWPKAHYFMHLPDQASLLNPRFVQNYINESLVGVMTRIWRSSANGPYQAVIQHTVCLRYLVMFAIKMDL